MKILLINKSATQGGAAVAAFRLFEALKKHGVEVNLLVQDSAKSELGVHSLSNSFKGKQRSFGKFVAERVSFLPFEKDKSVRYTFSPAASGENIVNHPLVQEADVIHLHWINHGFLSLKGLNRIFKLGKPIVWTMHDMWPFTGGCHYSGSCFEYVESCGNCPFLKKPSDKDLSYRILKHKHKIWEDANLNMVTCSNWLRNLALDSTLLKSKPIISIPNPINTDLFKPLDFKECRKRFKLPIRKKLILFGAANSSEPRKGIKYLLEALAYIKQNHTEWNDKMELVVFGKTDKQLLDSFPYKTHNLKFIKSKTDLIKLYNAADAFVLPSLQDNLPNTVMESLACGTPVVAFNVGGVPEMIQHNKTGYLANVKDSDALAKGMISVLEHQNIDELQTEARDFVLKNYANAVVAEQYYKLYNKVLNNK